MPCDSHSHVQLLNSAVVCTDLQPATITNSLQVITAAVLIRVAVCGSLTSIQEETTVNFPQLIF